MIFCIFSTDVSQWDSASSERLKSNIDIRPPPEVFLTAENAMKPLKLHYRLAESGDIWCRICRTHLEKNLRMQSKIAYPLFDLQKCENSLNGPF